MGEKHLRDVCRIPFQSWGSKMKQKTKCRFTRHLLIETNLLTHVESHFSHFIYVSRISPVFLSVFGRLQNLHVESYFNDKVKKISDSCILKGEWLLLNCFLKVSGKNLEKACLKIILSKVFSSVIIGCGRGRPAK